MSDKEVVERCEKGVLWVTLNRPERLNALTQPMMDQLREILDHARGNQDIRVIVLTGAGRGFCAGGDVQSMTDTDPDEMALEARAHQLRRNTDCALLLHEMPKPTITMARGAVAGAGLSLALATDMMIASDTLKLTSAFIKVGLSGDFGGTYFLTQRLGHRAREFALLSPKIDARQAAEMGLVNRVMADAELEDATRALAEEIAAGPGITQGHIKANMIFAEKGASLAEVLDHEAIRHVRCAMTQDHAEAAAAFVEKRTPVFRNR